MPLSLSIKNVPDDIVRRLKQRAQRNHRSLQGELRVIVESAVTAPPRLTLDEVLAKVRRLNLKTPSESVSMIRADRDGR